MSVEHGGNYRYDLTPIALDLLEANVTRFAQEAAPDANIVGVIVPHDAHVANFGRTGEQTTFTEMGEGYDFSIGMAPHEKRTRFLYTVDKRPILPEPRIIHVKRIVAPNPDIGQPGWDGRTGIEMIDDRLTAEAPEEHMELPDLLTASGLTIASLKSVLNVATNYTTKRVEKGNSLNMVGTLLSYHLLVRYGHTKGAEAIVAYQNRIAEISLGGFGAEKHLLGGREFHLPRTRGGYDEGYKAFIIPGTPTNLDLFLGEKPESPVSQVLAGYKLTTALVDYS